MKFWILAVLMVAGSAQAGVLATSPNNGGGRIILSDTQGDCHDNEMKAATYGKGGVTFGCWTGLGEGTNTIIIRWDDGDSRMYSTDGFQMTPRGNEWAAQQP